MSRIVDGRVRVLGSPLGVISQAPHLREKNTVRPAHIGAGQLWWYTHLGLRRARGTLAGAVKAGHMFTWLTSATAGQNIARTTSPLEDGINAGLKDLLRTHRGLTPDHAARAVGWYLYLRTEQPQDPWHLVQPCHWQPQRKNPTRVDEPIGPALYDTAFSTEDGNGIQQGWGGRRP